MARGLTTIAARIASEDGQKALKEYGIEVENLDGSLRSTYDVLGDVAKIWGDLTDAQRVALGETLAGKTRYNILAAVLQNYQHAIDATTTALNSQGSASRENAAYMESLEARTERIKGLFQELSNTIVGSDLVGGVLDLAGAFLELANTDFGGFIVKVGLLSTALAGLYGMLKAGILSEGIFGVMLPSLGTVAPYILGITTAVFGLIEALKLVKEELKKEADAKSFDKVSDAIAESETKIKDYENKIKDAKERLNELNQIPYAERTDGINEEIARLEALIDTYKLLQQQEEERLKQESLRQLERTQFTDGAKVRFIDDQTGGFLTKWSQYEGVMKAVNASYGSYEEAVYKVADAVQQVDSEFLEFMGTAPSVEAIARRLAQGYIEIYEPTHSFNEELNSQTQALSENLAQLKGKEKVDDSTIKSTEKLLEENKRYYDTLMTVKNSGAQLFDYQEEFIRSYEELSGAVTKAKNSTEVLSAAEKKIADLRSSAEFSRHALTLRDYINSLTSVEGIDTSNLGDILTYLKSIGAISLDYTASDLQEIIDQINSVESKDVQVDLDVNAEEGQGELDELENRLDELNSETGVTVTSSVDASNLVQSLDQIKQLIAELNTMSINIKISVNASGALSTLRNVRNAVTNIPTSWGINVYVNDYASGSLNNIASLLNGLHDKTIKVNVQRSDLQGKATGSNYFGGGPVLINDGAPVNGSSAELVVSNGKAQIYNNGEPTIEDLPKGSKIYTAAQTQQILKNIKALKDSIPAYADGNVTVPSEINAETIQYEPSEYYTKGDFEKLNTLEKFEKWQKERKHLLELDLITEEQYYLDLEEMNETYLKNIKDSQDKYWAYQEEIYKWKKNQLEDENELLEKQIELEKALGELAKVKSQKILVFKNGKFQYMADVDAISEAQRNVNSVLSGKGYANGTTNAKAGLHLVGENGPELRVLNSGDGIIPNNLTNKLLSMAKNGIGGLADTKEKAKQVFNSFNISNISLPNVKSAEDFFDGLKNYAYQYSYA